ncbi:hypothetical protein TEA_002918 [Camellia sinensis var. sinensis]|uniref:Small ribosomal subunit protein uS17 n=1 Tax=Camellia sinensis var. sinensis TaxID=542762 RepID=A0A4V3WP85_CAMSN|nr:hypothetical protein TEA_002918 [Camellia sinensis var. sinensis]
MRPSLLVSFLLLSILISEVQGISLRKGFLPVGHHKIHKAKVNRTSSAVVGEAVDDCKDRHCLGTLKKRISRTEKAFLKQPKVFLCSKKTGKGKRPGKGGNRFSKNVGLGFKTPREAIDVGTALCHVPTHQGCEFYTKHLASALGSLGCERQGRQGRSLSHLLGWSVGKMHRGYAVPLVEPASREDDKRPVRDKWYQSQPRSTVMGTEHEFQSLISFVFFYLYVLLVLHGTYIDKKCPFTGNVSIRGRILAGTCHSAKMMRTIIVRRNYLHFVKKYQRHNPVRHSNIPAHISPCFRVKEGDHVTIGQCRPLSKTVRFNVLKVIPAGSSGGGGKKAFAAILRKVTQISLVKVYRLLTLQCWSIIVEHVCLMFLTKEIVQTRRNWAMTLS